MVVPNLKWYHLAKKGKMYPDTTHEIKTIILFLEEHYNYRGSGAVG